MALAYQSLLPYLSADEHTCPSTVRTTEPMLSASIVRLSLMSAAQPDAKARNAKERMRLKIISVLPTAREHEYP